MLQLVVSLRELVRRSARVTHVDPKAEAGALAVAFAAHVAATAENVGDVPARLQALVSAHLDPRAAELIELIDRAMRPRFQESGAGGMGLRRLSE